MAQREIIREVIEYPQIKKSLIKDKFDFVVTETNYTKTIKQSNLRLFFTDDEKDFNELKLLNMVKRDAKLYIKNQSEQIKNVHESEIDFYKFFEYSNFKKNPNELTHVYKIDLSSAYWSHAVGMGIISKESQDFFLKMDSLDTYTDKKGKKSGFINGSKKARLKALGSLATRKLKTTYINGLQDGIPSIVQNEFLRNLYLVVCDEVDKIMKSICNHYKADAIYYYWDCVFLNAENIKPEDVLKFIKKFGFNAKFDESYISVDTLYSPMITDVVQKIDYCINQKDIL